MKIFSCKTFLLLLSLLYSINVFAQDGKGVTYLKRDNFGSVYITHDTSRIEYERLMPKGITADLKNSYNAAFIHLLKDTLINIPHFKLNEKLLLSWVPLYLKKDQFYVYSPSDWISHFAYLFTDSTIIRYKTDGPDVFIFRNYQEISNDDFKLQVLTYDKKTIQITIKLIDESKQISLWTFNYGDDKDENFLMTNAARVKEYPMVKCDCGDRKCLLEYEFDKIDKKMIRKKGW
jgi:hypothetical protein